MFANYLKTAIRNLTRNKFSSFINIAGLSAGMAVAVLTGLWVWDELSYNTSFANYNSIVQLKANADFDGKIYTIDSHPMPLATELRSFYRSYFKNVVMTTGTEQHVLAFGDKKFTQGGDYMQPEMPGMLSLNMLGGSRSGLMQTNSIMLSATTAKKLFGSADPINKLIKIDNKYTVAVTGVYQDLPDNTSFSGVTFMAPFNLYLSSYDWAQKKYTDWNNRSINIYAQLNPGGNAASISASIKNLLTGHLSGNQAKQQPQLFLQPMARWHLYSQFENGVNITSDALKLVWFYATIGMLVLLLACINFMNLSTARSEKRAKEAGIRKAIGSMRNQLVKQFFAESVAVAFCAFIVALAVVVLALPWFNNITEKNLSIPLTNPLFWLASLAFTLLTGLLAGSYPAFYLSSFNPVKVLKGTFRAGRLAALPRKALVVVQFTISIALAIGVITVYRQIQFAKNRPVGYSQQSLLQVAIGSPEFEGKYSLFTNELKNTGAVTDVAESASPVTSVWSTNTGFSWRGGVNSKQTEFATLNVTPQYGKTVGWQFVQGGDFTSVPLGDSTGFVLNETAAKLMNLQNPVGETMDWDAVEGKRFKVLGVVRDMVMESPYGAAYPAIFFIYPRDGANYMLLKLNANLPASTALAKIEAVFKKLVPSTPFAYAFVSDDFNKKFATEERTGRLTGAFAGLAVLISFLGMFGLAAFMAEQRTKEIGVRKVLGATVLNIWALLGRDFATLVVIALLVASPLAYWFMHNWLLHYAVHTNLAWWVFAATGAGALLTTGLTVSWQSIKAATVNPVRSLKDL